MILPAQHPGRWTTQSAPDPSSHMLGQPHSLLLLAARGLKTTKEKKKEVAAASGLLALYPEINLTFLETKG